MGYLELKSGKSIYAPRGCFDMKTEDIHLIAASFLLKEVSNIVDDSLTASGVSFCSLNKFRPLAITISDCHLDIALVSLESLRACITAVHCSSCVEADLVSSASVVLDSVLILIALRCRAPEAAKAAENVQLKKISQSLLSIGKKMEWADSAPLLPP